MLLNTYQPFDRNNQEVKIMCNTDLGTCKPYYPFIFNCGDQEVAELLTRHLNGEFEKFTTDIAKNAYNYLEGYQISELKKYLNKNWNAKTECWK